MKTKHLLILIILLGAGIRLLGITWGLPNKGHFTPYYADEYTPLHALSKMNPSKLDFNPHYFDNPTFFYYQLGATLQVAKTLGLIKLTGDRVYYLTHQEEYGRLFLTGRLLVTFYSLLLILLAFFLTRSLFGDRPGLWAALLMALMPLPVFSSVCLDVSTPVTFWLGLSVWALILSVQKESQRWFYMGCVFSGLAISTKYLAVPIGLPIFVAHFFLTKKIISKTFFLGCLTMVAAFFAGTPYILVDFGTFLADFITIIDFAGVHKPRSLNPTPIHLGYTMGWLTFLAAIGGLALGLRKKKASVWIAASFTLSYFLALTMAHASIARYYLVLNFFFAPFAALAIDQLFFLPARGKILGRLVVAGLIGMSLVRSGALVTLLHDQKNDSRVLASTWIENNIPEKSSIGVLLEPYWSAADIIYTDYHLKERYAVLERPQRYSYDLIEKKDYTNHQRPLPDYIVYTDADLKYWKLRFYEFSDDVTEPPLMVHYEKVKEFTRYPQWGPFHFPRKSYHPVDWWMPFPKITVMKRTT